MTSIIDKSPKNQFLKSAAFTAATSASFTRILKSDELLLLAALTFPVGLAATSSQDFKKTRFFTSILSGFLISDRLLPASNDPKINIAKTAALIGMIYLALCPNKKNNLHCNQNLPRKQPIRHNVPPLAAFRRQAPLDQAENPFAEPRITRHAVGSARHQENVITPRAVNERIAVGSRQQD